MLPVTATRSARRRPTAPAGHRDGSTTTPGPGSPSAHGIGEEAVAEPLAVVLRQGAETAGRRSGGDGPGDPAGPHRNSPALRSRVLDPGGQGQVERASMGPPAAARVVPLSAVASSPSRPAIRRRVRAADGLGACSTPCRSCCGAYDEGGGQALHRAPAARPRRRSLRRHLRPARARAAACGDTDQRRARNKNDVSGKRGGLGAAPRCAVRRDRVGWRRLGIRPPVGAEKTTSLDTSTRRAPWRAAVASVSAPVAVTAQSAWT